jgi:hypothetical protein
MIRPNTVKKYFNALKYLKSQFDDGSLNSIRDFEKKFKISNRTYRTLLKLNVITKHDSFEGSFYQWNNKIPVTMLLAQKVVTTNNEVNALYMNKKPKQKNKAIFSNQISTPIKIESPKKVSDVGLIRRFFRWIY